MTMQQRTAPWSLRDFVVLGAIAVVFGFLFLQWVPVWLAVRAFGPVAQELMFGFWFVGGILSALIIRKPGAAILGEFAAALAEVLFGSPVGIPLLVTGLVQGLGAELVFALYRYKRYTLWTAVLAGAVAAVVALPWNWWRLAYFALAPALQLVLLGARVVSGAVLGGVGSHILAQALARTGVLANFPIGRSHTP
jgi:energy-coupling factor transport system substrate-specific component